MRAFLSCLTLAAALLALGLRPAHADPDEPIGCKIGIVKAGKLSKMVCRGGFSLPSTPATTTGGAVTFRDLGGGSMTYPLPAAGWKGLGNPPGASGFKFHDLNCPAVLVKTNVVKAVCKDPNTLPLPLGTDLFVTLALPASTPTKRYCAQFGGIQMKNSPTIFKAKEAGPPASCDPPPPPTTSAPPHQHQPAARLQLLRVHAALTHERRRKRILRHRQGRRRRPHCSTSPAAGSTREVDPAHNPACWSPTSASRASTSRRAYPTRVP